MALHYTLNEKEIELIYPMIEGLKASYRSVDDKKFLNIISLYSHQLPFALRKALNDFRLADENSDYMVISGFPVDQDEIGPTPTHWDQRKKLSATLKQEIFMMLVAELLGDAFGWATQQSGNICHDILPVKEMEHEQVGASSQCILNWHTEDAFHPLRGDYLCLMCLRNPDGTPTTIGSLDLSLLSDEQVEVLFESRFAIKPDHSHKKEFRGREEVLRDIEEDQLDQSYDRMTRLDQMPELIPVLYGHKSAPYICIDPVYMDHPATDKIGREALHALVQALDHNMQNVVLRPGELALLDNARVVHGRQPFTARYDGTDRWMKRINLTTDLRKSHAVRGGESMRLIF